MLSIKTKSTKVEKYKFDILVETLNEVPIEFAETKQFIEQYLEQKRLKENISVEELIYFF